MVLGSKWRGGLRRRKIRQLYNQSKWEEAEKQAIALVDCKVNGEFARDIVIRSLWNLEKWREVIQFSNEYPSDGGSALARRARMKLGETEYPEKPDQYASQTWNSQNLLDNWYQENETLWLRHPWGWTYWIMPSGFQLEKTHPSLLALALNVLLKPWVPETQSIEVECRNHGGKLALSYSGGVDSTAAAILLPDDTILAYHMRSFSSMLSHDLPKQLFEAIKGRWERDVLEVQSNHEKIRTYHGKQTGFSTDYAAGVHLILLADYLDLNGISFGTPIDNTWLKKGRKFRDFSETWHWKYWKDQFARAGLHLVMPINHISEAGALRICEQSDLIDVINSCLRGKGTEYCGKCWKCFHKNGPLGRDINPQSNEIQNFLTKMPLRTAQHALWAIQLMQLEHLVPHLSDEFKQSLHWWEHAYLPGLELIQDPWKTVVEERTRKFLPIMERPQLLHQVDLFPDIPF